MLDLVPHRGVGWELAHRDIQAGFGRELGEFDFPFQARKRYPLEPPASAVSNNRRAPR
jgi:hypothetical protein